MKTNNGFNAVRRKNGRIKPLKFDPGFLIGKLPPDLCFVIVSFGLPDLCSCFRGAKNTSCPSSFWSRCGINVSYMVAALWGQY